MSTEGQPPTILESAPPATAKAEPAGPGFRYGLWLANLRSIQEEFYAYRDYAPVGPEATRGSGQILPFVRGLYLSAKIIYFIREVLHAKDLNVNWGHIIHETQIYCSPECDIIIHKHKSARVWNGDVLDFHFVDTKHVVAVVSCKSEVNSIDDEYYKKMTAFGITRVGLIGEVASRTNFDNLRSKAQAAGYADFWCLALQDALGRAHNEPSLVQFIQFLEAL